MAPDQRRTTSPYRVKDALWLVLRRIRGKSHGHAFSFFISSEVSSPEMVKSE